VNVLTIFSIHLKISEFSWKTQNCLGDPKLLYVMYDAGMTFKCPLLPFSVSTSSSVPSRCEVGDDWWYYGSSCQYKGSTSDSTTLALASSLSVLGGMLLVTGLSVYCLKKKYKKRSHDSSVVMENVSATK